MSSDAIPAPQPQPAPAPAAPTWEPLSPLDRRILGVLVEKQKTSKTADSYPLSLNALVTGCNQKSNRDPVFELDEIEVEEGLDSLQERGLVTRITGGRVDRFRHELYGVWTSAGPELAVLAELLLRGPQTKGDLRTRAARMAPIDSLDVLDEVLKPLLERKLVVYLTEPDRRGAVVTHGLHAADEIARLKALHAGAPVSVSDPEVPVFRPVPVAGPAPALDTKLTAAVAEIDALKARVATLEAQLADVQKQLGLSPA
ncbi:DUF480 domain-containing protein [Gemmata sp. G18]|uniref:DUF480 domain-containing protein n=1 Tax=Gemmata palustris TaxID=2822762 RepID=A0ABS5BZZ5_9BACT|nr:DUF480 domain-containing protein [Gemmata palustris]MBP3959304.1 DUF480 domain-containing protein [Gemmata palustris]